MNDPYCYPNLKGWAKSSLPSSLFKNLKLERLLTEQEFTYADHKRITIEINYLFNLTPSKQKMKTKNASSFFKSLSDD